MKAINIQINGPVLSKIVQQLLFDSGIKWNSEDVTPLYLSYPNISMFVSDKRMFLGTDSHAEISFNAATQMGELKKMIRQQK